MSIVRIIERPAIDAQLARLTHWWNGLSARERVLVGTLGVILALVVLVYGVVKPLQAARADAIADIRTYETLNARLRAAGPRVQAQMPTRTGTPAEIVTQSAASVGVAVQATPTASGVDATVADATYDAVMQWIADVGRTSRLAARSVRITRAAPGRVSAQASFS